MNQGKASPRDRGRAAARLIANVIAPLALYYGLRAAGVGVYTTQIISTVIPAGFAAYGLIRERRIDGLALYMVSMLTLSLVVSLVSGSVRFLLAREGWLTGVTGLWFIASVWAPRPLAFHYSKPLLERTTGPDGYGWDELWDRLPRFRRIWRIASVAWGAGLLADSAIRVMMAYTLPIDVVPALGTALYVATSLVLIVATNIYYIASGLYNRRSALYQPLTATAHGGEEVVAARR